MRRPALTKAQRAHAKQARALLRLRKAAVRYSVPAAAYAAALREDEELWAELEAACDAYANTLTVRELRKLSRR